MSDEGLKQRKSCKMSLKNFLFQFMNKTKTALCKGKLCAKLYHLIFLWLFLAVLNYRSFFGTPTYYRYLHQIPYSCKALVSSHNEMKIINYTNTQIIYPRENLNKKVYGALFYRKYFKSSLQLMFIYILFYVKESAHWIFRSKKCTSCMMKSMNNKEIFRNWLMPSICTVV